MRTEKNHCPYHKDETLYQIKEDNKGFCIRCKKFYFLSKIEELRKPGVRSVVKTKCPV